MSPQLITFTIYLIAMISIGIFAFFYTKNLDDYILGGRRIGGFVTALSAGASDMSAWLLMGLPSAIFVLGISQSWIAVSLIAGAYLNWLIIAGRLRVFTEHFNNSLTLPDYFSSRFADSSRALRLIAALIILFFFTIYCASGIVGGAKLFQSMFGLDYGLALFLGAGVTIIYTFIGGFFAVSWTDTIQASLMLFALILTPIMVIIAVGGFDNSIELIKAKGPTLTHFFDHVGFISIISALGWGLGYFGQPHILTRFMAAESHNVMKNARRIGMMWMILCLIGAIIVGFLGIAYFSMHPEFYYLVDPAAHKQEQIFIQLSNILFNPWVSGVILAGILAAVMSTLSCQLLVCSSAVTEDLYHAFFRKTASTKELVWVGRAMVLLISFISILIALNPKSSVLGLVSHAWAGFGAAFGPIILLSLFWSRMNKYGALAGMVVGATVVVVWEHYQWFDLYCLIPGFVFATITIIIVSLLTKSPNNEIKNQFTTAMNVYKKK